MDDEPKEETAEQAYAAKQVEASGSSSECKKHFGYLSEQSSKDSIPDECMMYKYVIQCMLKKAKERVCVS